MRILDSSPRGMSLGNPISILDSPLDLPRNSSILGSLEAQDAQSLSPSVSPELYNFASPLLGPPPLVPGSTFIWPNNMYVVDMVHGFRKMNELRLLDRENYEDRFRKVFHQSPPSSSTYHDQVRRWSLSSALLRETSLHAQRTSAGHWARFAKLVPLKK